MVNAVNSSLQSPPAAGISSKIASLTRRHNLFTHFLHISWRLGPPRSGFIIWEELFPALFTDFIPICICDCAEDAFDATPVMKYNFHIGQFVCFLSSCYRLMKRGSQSDSSKCLFSPSNFIYFLPLCASRFLLNTSCHCFRLFLRDYLKCCHLYFLQCPCAFKGFRNKNKTFAAIGRYVIVRNPHRQWRPTAEMDGERFSLFISLLVNSLYFLEVRKF